jgi:hypothetical protein
LFVAYDHTIGNENNLQMYGAERALSTRYFEGAAGGAVMIGSKPPVPEFLTHFDWSDAVIEIPRDPQDMSAILADLYAQPERLARISRANAIQSLKRHDWAYRWAEVLTIMGMTRSPKLDHRLDKLKRLSDEAERADFKATAGLRVTSR